MWVLLQSLWSWIRPHSFNNLVLRVDYLLIDSRRVALVVAICVRTGRTVMNVTDDRMRVLRLVLNVTDRLLPFYTNISLLRARVRSTQIVEMQIVRIGREFLKLGRT